MNRLRASHSRPYAATCSFPSITPGSLYLPAFRHYPTSGNASILLQDSLLSPTMGNVLFVPSTNARCKHSLFQSHWYSPSAPNGGFPQSRWLHVLLFPYIDAIPHVHLFSARSSFSNLSYTASSKTCLSTPSEESSSNLNRRPGR